MALEVFALLHKIERRLREEFGADSVRVEHNHERQMLDFHAHWPHSDRRITWSLTETELTQRDVKHWANVVIAAADAARVENANAYRDPGSVLAYTCATLMYSCSIGGGFLNWGTGSRPEAEERARDLFVMTLGEPAIELVNSNAGLPVTGSQGGDYRLHAMMSYCVSRPSDGARLCAVVPGVPLYDHLLGIKLMIENDEPEFLRTANVSGGRQTARVRATPAPRPRRRSLAQRIRAAF